MRAIVQDGSSIVTRRPWDEVLTTEEIARHGDLVVASFGAESSRLWYQTLLARDSLLATG